jgi:glycosyltransferase involved in cell wall biosynthesis
MHLFIQIPSFNEEKSIAKVIASIPKKILGVKKITIVVIDDGSTDNTTLIVKKKFPYVKIISNIRNLGLAETFKRGIDFALFNGADIIVNIDGDNQYKSSDITRLIQPIISKNTGGGVVDYTIGERKFNNIRSFSIIKKFLQYSGNWFINKIIETKTKDVTSGFRAFNRNAASKIYYTNNFTYTIESLLYFSDCKLLFKGIDIETNAPERKSRLFKNNFEYITKTFLIIIKIVLVKKPLQLFSFISLLTLLSGIFFCLDWHNLWLAHQRNFSVTPKLLLGTTLIIISLQTFILGIVNFLNSKSLHINLEILSKIKQKK